MADYDGGRVFLSVVPSFRNVQRLIGAQASAWGREAGDRFNDAFNRELERNKAPAPGPGSTQSRKEGAESGGAYADAFRRRLEAATRALPPVRIGVATSQAEQELRDLRRDLESLSARTVGVDIDAAAATAEVQRIETQLARLASESPDVRVRVDAAAARAEMAALQAQISRLDSQSIDIEVNVDRRGVDQLGDAGAQSSRALSALVTAGVLLGPAIIPVAGAAAAALAGIGAGAVAGVAGLGVLAIGFSGVADAVKAMSEVRQNADVDSQRATASARQVASAQAGLANAESAAADSIASASQRQADARRKVGEATTEAAENVAAANRRVTDAERAVTTASRESAEQVAAASRRVIDARRAVVDATDDATRAVGAALERQGDAERALAAAQQNTRAAQEDLTRARVDAQARLDDLSLTTRSAALAEEDAELGLIRARERLAEARTEGAGGVDLAEADLAVRQAVLRLDEARDRNSEVQAEALAATRAGVDGAQTVLDAGQKVARARASETDAARNLQSAEAAVAQTRIDGADRIAQAQRSLADADIAAVQARVNGAERVASAQRSLVDAEQGVTQARVDGAERVAQAQRSLIEADRAHEAQHRQSAFAIAQAEAALASASEQAGQMSTSVRKLRDEMAGLSPAGQAFAQFLFGLAPMWARVREVAQEGLLPGVQSGIESLMAVLPRLLPVVGAIAVGLGGMFAAAGAGLASEPWLRFFEYLAGPGMTSLMMLGQAFGGFALGFGQLLMALQPVTDQVLGGLVSMAERFVVWSANLDQNTGFQKLLGYMMEVGPFVVDVLGSIWRGVAQLAEALAPFGALVLSAFAGLFDFIAGLDVTTIRAWAVGLTAAWVALQVLLLSANLGRTFIVAWAGAVKIAEIATAIWTGVMFAFNAVMAGNPIALVILAVVALVAAIVIAYNTNDTFRAIVQNAWVRIQEAVMWAWVNVLKPAFEWIAGFTMNTLVPALMWLWQNVVVPAFAGIGAAISWAWKNIIQPIFTGLQWYVANVLGPVIIWLWRNIFEPAFSGIRTVISVVWAAVRILFDALVWYVRNVLAPIVTWLWRNVVQPAFEGIAFAINVAWVTIIKPVLQALGDFISGTVAPAFNRGVDAIGSAWDRIRSLAAAPVNFVIETVYMRGIKPLFDKIAAAVGSDVRMPVVRPIGAGSAPARSRLGGYADGGVLPGYTPGRDVHRFYSPTAGTLELSGGEPILRPEAGAVLGRGWVDGVNAAARTGGTGGVTRYLGGFAGGGWLDTIGDAARGAADFGAMAREGIASALSSAKDFVVGGLKAAAERVLSPITSSLGGLGDGMLPDLLKGLVKRSATSLLGFAGKGDEAVGSLEGGSFGSASGGWPRAIMGRLSANTAAAVEFMRNTFGISNIGTLGNRPNRSDHPMGKALDIMIRDWTSPAGIAKGNQVANHFIANPGMFGTKYVIWRDQINSGSGWRAYTHPNGPTNNPTLQHRDHIHTSLYDQGGMIPPGLSTVMNATGKPEAVFNEQQLRDMRGGRSSPALNVRVWVGDREITDIVRTEVGAERAGMARALSTGRR